MGTHDVPADGRATPAPRRDEHPPPRDAEALATWVQAAQAGSHAGFSELVRHHQRAVFFLCRRYVNDDDTASELTQRTFIRALEGLPDLREPAAFRGWLLRIAAHLSLNYLRDHARFVALDDAPPNGSRAPAAAPDTPLTPDEALSLAQDTAALRRLIAQLPTKQRMTLELRIYEDLSFADIGRALEIQEGAAKVNFHYAVKRLRHWLRPEPARSDPKLEQAP